MALTITSSLALSHGIQERFLNEQSIMEIKGGRHSWLINRSSPKPFPLSSQWEDYSGLMSLLTLARRVISMERPRKKTKLGASSPSWRKSLVRNGGGGGESPWWLLTLFGEGNTHNNDGALMHRERERGGRGRRHHPQSTRSEHKVIRMFSIRDSSKLTTNLFHW